MSGKNYLLVDFLPTSSFSFLSSIYLLCIFEEKFILTLLMSMKLDHQHTYQNMTQKN